MSLERVPCVAGLFSDNDGVATLHGSRCAGCNTPYFPKSASCHNPQCTESRMEDFDFGGKGCYGATPSPTFHLRRRISLTSLLCPTQWAWWIWRAACA